jgi:hypothetical protein
MYFGNTKFLLVWFDLVGTLSLYKLIKKFNASKFIPIVISNNLEK